MIVQEYGCHMPSQSRQPHVFTAWPAILNRVSTADGILLGLDVDGTLAPIALHPSLAVIPQTTTSVLRRLITASRLEVAFVSGRAAADLMQQTGIREATYASNHGFEIRQGEAFWKHPAAAPAEQLMKELTGELDAALAGFSGAEIEPKGPTLSIHYRRLKSARNIPSLLRTIRQIALPFERAGKLRLTRGKMVVELRPPAPWGKGHALASLIAGSQLVTDGVSLDPLGAYRGPTDGRLPIYVGDDHTDEDGFKAIEKLGITIKVGPPRALTSAHYRLRSPDEVCQFLERLAETLDV